MDAKTENRGRFLIHTAYLLLLCALAYVGGRYVLGWMLPFVLGHLIATLLRPAAKGFSQWTRCSEKTAGWTVVLGAYFLLGALLFVAGVLLAGQMQRAALALPSLYNESLRPALLNLENAARRLLEGLSPGLSAVFSMEQLSEKVQNMLFSFSGNVLSWLGTATAKLPGFFMGFLFTIACSLIISANYGQVTGFIARQFPAKGRQVLFSAKSGAAEVLVGYCKAYSKLMLMTFAALTLGLCLLRVENAFAIAAFIALLDALPLLGTGAALLPWAAIHLLCGNMPLAVGLALLYGITATLHSILEPRLVGRQLGLHPLVSLCAIYLGYRCMGVSGMIVMPMAAQILVSLQQSGVLRFWR